MTSPYAELEVKISNLPPFYKYKCTSDNRSVTRNIKNMSRSELEELNKKLESEYEEFKDLLDEHRKIDMQCESRIIIGLETIRADSKQKDIYKLLNNRYRSAMTSKDTTFLGVSDLGTNIKSVAGNHLLNFIIRFHRHKCQYTNMFKEFCGDTKKELLRIKQIYDCEKLSGLYSASSSDDDDEKFTSPQLKDTKEKCIADIKDAIAAVELDVDEDW